MHSRVSAFGVSVGVGAGVGVASQQSCNIIFCRRSKREEPDCAVAARQRWQHHLPVFHQRHTSSDMWIIWIRRYCYFHQFHEFPRCEQKSYTIVITYAGWTRSRKIYTGIAMPNIRRKFTNNSTGRAIVIRCNGSSSSKKKIIIIITTDEKISYFYQLHGGHLYILLPARPRG